MNLPTKIVIGADHAGFEYKEAIKQYLSKNNIEIIESQKGLKKLVQFIEHLFFKKIAENKVWDKPFSSVYRAIYNDFDDFFEQSNINRVITSEEQRFLKKAFAHFKQRNEVIY